MKYFALALATSLGLACAADFTTGQAARLLIGQLTFTKQDVGASEYQVGAVGGLAYANNTLFVADSNRVGASPLNQRVLIYSNLAQNLFPPTAEIPTDTGLRCPICMGVATTVLGQPDFLKTDIGLAQNSFRLPTAVASDGKYLAVADTDNNRVLIWNSIPATNQQPADVVVGQPDFKTGTSNFGGGNTPSAKGLRGPQGVWFQDGRLIVSDTQNHRVLIWNRVPASNGAAADVVVGQPNFTTYSEPNLLKLGADAKANNLLNPVAATSDGRRLYVTDLGHHRVLIYNSIPTSNGAAADIVLGQPNLDSTNDVNSAVPNNSKYLCPSNGTDSSNNLTFPVRCAATMEFPRYAVSDGTKLFIADGGNNRVLVYNSVPTSNGQRADVILGQKDDSLADDGTTQVVSASNSLRTPMSLAWDGSNLYVADTFNRRIMVFTVAEQTVVNNSVRNSASFETFASGTVTFSGSVKENDIATITINSKDYKYTIRKDDTLEKIIKAMVDLINASGGDPNVVARANVAFNEIVLTSKTPGEDGNNITLTTATSNTTASTTPSIVLTASAGLLTGGRDAAKIAPGTLISIVGNNFTSQTLSADTSRDKLPTTLGGVQVYVDGIRAPLVFVSPTQINAQMPFEVSDTTSVSVFVRTSDGSGTRVSTAIGVPIVPQNPGIFAASGVNDPRPAIALHSSSYAQGAISVDGTIKANDTATVTVEDRTYTYTVQSTDTLASVRDALIQQINAADPKVKASPAGAFTRIRLQAKAPGPDGEGIPYSAKANDGASLIMSSLGSVTCCANVAGSPVTDDNPAVPGEVITVYATGLGLVGPDDALAAAQTGLKYNGPALNDVNAFIDAIAGGKTANVLFSGLKTGQVGVYELQLQLNTDIPTNPQTQLTIAQDVYISNIVTFPVRNPNNP